MKTIERLRKVSLLSNVLMILTSIHHVYGAYRYHTPERLHVLFISIPVTMLTVLLGRRLVKNKTGISKVLFSVFIFIVTVPSLLLIGLFEGVYNHILKNVLYFAGTPDNVMREFFRSKLYEMPNDVFFEITGIAQGLIAVPLLMALVQLLKSMPFANNKEDR